MNFVNEAITPKPSNVKFIAMIDLFAFLLLLLLSLYGLSQEDINIYLAELESVTKKFEDLDIEKKRFINQIAELNENIRILNAKINVLYDENMQLKGELGFQEVAYIKIGEDKENFKNKIKELSELIALLNRDLADKDKELSKLKSGFGGNFQTAGIFFNAAEFDMMPVDRPRYLGEARKKIKEIIQKYSLVKSEFPFIFIIGHANTLGEKDVVETDIWERRKKNWKWATRRAAVIASMLGEERVDMEKVVIVSTGEFDLKYPVMPTSQENAWVEIVFGRHWKLPAKDVR